MHFLSRQIRFAIDPFSASSQTGANSYCAKPTADGLAFFFSLWIQLKGSADKDTGFVINVSDIDKIIRQKAIVIFEDFIKTRRLAVAGTATKNFGQLLSKIWKTIEKDFKNMKINSLTLELMPARKLAIKERSGKMLYFSEKFEFSASHTLWNKKFSEKENFKIFGKCANKQGHGHNYIVEVTIKKTRLAPAPVAGVQSFEDTVDKHFIQLVDHKNLNDDVKYFKKTNPTVENIAQFAFKCLKDKFKPAKLDCITVWENDRTFCTFRND